MPSTSCSTSTLSVSELSKGFIPEIDKIKPRWQKNSNQFSGTIQSVFLGSSIWMNVLLAWLAQTAWDDSLWRKSFRMTKFQFYGFLELVDPNNNLSCFNTNLKQGLKGDTLMAMTLLQLRTGQTFHKVGLFFGTTDSTVWEAVDERLTIICSKSQNFISFPNPDQALQISQEIKQEHGFPQVVGFMDRMIAAIRKPNRSGHNFAYRKGGYGINSQVVIDNYGIFRDIDVGSPASSHDSRVFKRSSLHSKLQHGLIPLIPTVYLQRPKEDGTIEEIEVSRMVVADQGYPLSGYVQTPISDRMFECLTWQERLFCYLFSKIRVTVECAIGHVKGKWRILLRGIDAKKKKTAPRLSSHAALYTTIFAFWNLQSQLTG